MSLRLYKTENGSSHYVVTPEELEVLKVMVTAAGTAGKWQMILMHMEQLGLPYPENHKPAQLEYCDLFYVGEVITITFADPNLLTDRHRHCISSVEM